MGISGGIMASLAGRYASALYELASEQGVLAAVEGDCRTLEAAIGESADLAGFLTDPQVARDAAQRTVAALAQALALDGVTAKFLGVLAANRRLAHLGAMLRAFAAIAADARGEVTAHVTSAHPLNAEQLARLADRLAAREGHTVTLQTRVDPAILGGLVVQIGSQMVDASIRTRLNTLAQAMTA